MRGGYPLPPCGLWQTPLVIPHRIEDIDWSRWRARDLATLVFHVRGDEILLIRKKRGLGAGKINGPGGKLEPGETAEQCARREVHEELGIRPIGLEQLGETRFQFIDGYSIHVHVFRADDFEGTPQATAEAEPLWYRTSEIPYDEMWEDDRLWLPYVLDRIRFEGRFTFDGDAMLDYELELRV